MQKNIATAANDVGNHNKLSLKSLTYSFSLSKAK